ncbi:hypothetical protein M430DRAFT_48127 [Amorphotheca resinae ATCC 22711]|uniref:Uncharacterized protein n=1 Tax=Amorphotheca resinae ATCC 22711 TaxID=857342 RepID=A0A2T3BBQ1_AMORE|nr:hypothetical protein M430DRAFT_48127 [Amorphotheca resinae ATCC 22711]PSS25699.1 hypothetical protein M430DRAFT_48127 [Amorphotheca resinae ATCC 22711]
MQVRLYHTVIASESSNFENLLTSSASPTLTRPPAPHFPQATSSYTLATSRSMALSPRSRPN